MYFIATFILFYFICADGLSEKNYDVWRSLGKYCAHSCLKIAKVIFLL